VESFRVIGGLLLAVGAEVDGHEVTDAAVVIAGHVERILRKVAVVGQRRIVEVRKLGAVEILVGCEGIERRARRPLIARALPAAGTDQLPHGGAGADLPDRRGQRHRTGGRA
jgi:hypothetical protein